MLTRYYDLLDRHPVLRERYIEREGILFGDLQRGALVGFYGQENASHQSPCLSFGHVIAGPMPLIDTPEPIRQVVAILHENGKEICRVPLGLLQWVAFPNPMGVWNIYNEEREFDKLFVEGPSFEAVTSLKCDAVHTRADFDDPYLRALARLVKNFGQPVLMDAARVRGVLLDFAPKPEWCVNTLIQAIQSGIVERLMSSFGQPYELSAYLLIKRLYDAGPPKERARWAVDTLAAATGRVSQEELVWRDIFSRELTQLDSADHEGVKIEGSKQYEKTTFEAHKAKELGVPLRDYIQRKRAHYLEPETECCAMHAVTPYLKAYVVVPDEVDVFGDAPHWTDSNGADVKNGTIARLRDVAGRLMFSYGFSDVDAAGRALSALKTFHQNRSNLVR